MTKGLLLDAGQIKVVKDTRTVITTGGTLVHLLPTLRTFSTKTLSFPHPPMSYYYFWRGSQDWSSVLTDDGIKYIYAQLNSGQTLFTALGQEYETFSTLMTAPAGADIFFGWVRLSRTVAPTHTWYFKTISPLLPENVWIPWNGSGMLENALGLTRLMHLVIEGGELRIVFQQSVSSSPMGHVTGYGGSDGSGNPSAIFRRGEDQNGGQCSVGPAGEGFLTWTSSADPYFKQTPRNVGPIDTVQSPGLDANHHPDFGSASQLASTVNPTNYLSTYNIEVKGYFGRRSK